jgi:hypothetical protein
MNSHFLSKFYAALLSGESQYGSYSLVYPTIWPKEHTHAAARLNQPKNTFASFKELTNFCEITFFE